MPKRPDDKLKVFTLRLPVRYVEKLKAESFEKQITLADLIRSRIQDQAVKPLVQPLKRKRPKLTSKYIMVDPEVVREFARIGNNMNQLARWVNTYKSRGDCFEVLYVLSVMEKQMKEAIQRLR